MGILWRPKLAIIAKPEVIVPGRVLSMSLWLRGLGLVHVASVYADVHAPPAAQAMFISALMTEAARGGTRLLGGDFNLESGPASTKLTHGVVHAGPDPTFVTKKVATYLDYFVASPLLGPALTPVTMSLGLRCGPHRAVAIKIQAATPDVDVRVMPQYKPGDTDAVLGPKFQCPCWETWHEHFSATRDIYFPEGWCPAELTPALRG